MRDTSYVGKRCVAIPGEVGYCSRMCFMSGRREYDNDDYENDGGDTHADDEL